MRIEKGSGMEHTRAQEEPEELHGDRADVVVWRPRVVTNARCAHDAPSSSNQNARSQPSSRAYSRSCRSFSPSFSSIIRYAVHSISCSARIVSSVIPPPPPPPTLPTASAPTVHPTRARSRPSCTNRLCSSAASFGAVVACGPRRRTSAAVSNLVAKTREWKDGFIVLEREAYMRLLTSISVDSSRGGPICSLVTTKNAMLSSTSCGIESKEVGIPRCLCGGDNDDVDGNGDR